MSRNSKIDPVLKVELAERYRRDEIGIREAASVALGLIFSKIFSHPGRAALIHVLSKKLLQLVAVYDVDPAKVGKDAGEIFGYEKAGIIVTDDREAVLNTEADAVLYYTPQMYVSPIMTQEHLTPTCDEICEILSHKKNLITTVCLYHSKKKAPAILTLKDIFRNTETFSLQVPHPA